VVIYGIYNDDPSLLIEKSRDNYTDSFVYINGTWKRLHPAEIATNAYVMTEADWARRFGPLTLPDEVR
jgi:hypothetical protein